MDEERFELSIFPLEAGCFSIKLFIHNTTMISHCVICWLRKNRTFISAFVAQYSYPLNYKPIEPQNRRIKNLEWRSWKPVNRNCFHFFIPCSSVLLFFCSFRLSPGIEPCSPPSQEGALPNKLKTTFDAGIPHCCGITQESNSCMLPITPSGSLFKPMRFRKRFYIFSVTIKPHRFLKNGKPGDPASGGRTHPW